MVLMGLGTGMLEDASGIHRQQGPVPLPMLTDEKELPKAQGPSDPFGPDQQSHIPGVRPESSSVPGMGASDASRKVIAEVPYQAHVFILESLKEL